MPRPPARPPARTDLPAADPATPAEGTAPRTPGARLQMTDIARLAGVSASTVSRALAGSPLVNEATRRRVVDLARQLNYTINVGAQNLRLKQNRTIAVVVPFDPETRQHLSDPFFLSLIGSLADALTDRGHEMLLSRVDATRLDLGAQAYETGRAAGIVLVGQWRHHDQLNELALRGVPLAVWGGLLPGQSYATVGSDNVQGGVIATRHLLARGARRIAYFGDIQLPEIALRHAGWAQALRDAGLEVDPALERHAPFVEEAIVAELDAFVASGTPFDAVFAASDLMAMTLVNALRRHGRRVPEDVQVCGYDDIPLARYFHPPLTTVRQPIEEAGRALVAELLAQIGGAHPSSTLLPTTLEARESTRAEGA